MLAFLGILVPRALAEAPPAPVEAPKPPITAPLSVDALIAQSAQTYGVSGRLMARIIDCESGDDPTAIGDQGTSFGLVQIHLPAHTDITKTQALDPAFAIGYLARQLSLGNGDMWSCYGG